MRRTPVSAGFEGDLRLVCSFHEIGPVDTVSFEAQNKVRINLGDIFTELLNVFWSESARVRITLLVFPFFLQLMIWIGSRVGLGAPVLLTDRSEKEKRSSLGGSSLAMARGCSFAVSVS